MKVEFRSSRREVDGRFEQSLKFKDSRGVSDQASLRGGKGEAWTGCFPNECSQQQAARQSSNTVNVDWR